MRHRPRRPARHFSSPAIGGGDPRDGEWPWLDDDASDAGEPERSFLGVVGQLAAALLAVAAIVALLIAAAIAFGWILP